MRCWIEVSADAIRKNYKIFETISQPAQVIPIIKSNAYGHGFAEIQEILKPFAPPFYGVNYIEEANQLRESSYQGRILVVGPVPQSLYQRAQSLGAEIFIGDEPSLKFWIEMKKPPLAHIKVDTGMSRQGFTLPELESQLKKMLPRKEQIKGIASHFANVEDVVEHSYADLQVERFEKAQSIAKGLGLHLETHIASSASTLLMSRVLKDFTRVGISLYGLWPSQATRLSFLQTHHELAQLQPALSWRTEIALTKTVAQGDYIGYGCTYRAMKDMRIAVLPVGYYEGYPRLASGRGSYVLIHGKRCPVVGRICMNMMMVDINDVPEATAGDIVTLIGKDGPETIDSESLASWAETIHYELLSCLNSKIPRRIIGETNG